MPLQAFETPEERMAWLRARGVRIEDPCCSLRCREIDGLAVRNWSGFVRSRANQVGLHPVAKAGKHVVAAWADLSLPSASLRLVERLALAGRSFAFVRIPVEDAQTCEASLPR